jgi:DNA (cytosine-5)-methyltransferase 1
LKTVASLFSGAGGLDLAFALWGRFAGQFKIAFANDVLKAPGETYSRNFRMPVVPARAAAVQFLPAFLLGDVREIDFEALGPSDVLIGGPPCQDFSVVRGPDWDRKGLEGPKGMLLTEMVRAARALRPKVVVFENVPGLLSANSRRPLQLLVKAFGEAGYRPAYVGIASADHFGAPQRRRRLIALFVDAGPSALDAAQVACAEVLSPQRSIFAKYPLTPLEAFEGMPLCELGQQYRNIMAEYGELAADWTGDAVRDYLRLNRISPASQRELEAAFASHASLMAQLGWLGRPVSLLALADRSADIPRESPHVLARMREIPPGANHTAVRGTEWEVEGRGISLVYRRLHPLKPAYTVVAYGGGGTWGYHYARNRSKLSHRERARLQTFPDWFEFCGGEQEKRAQIGEAVPPVLAEAVAEAVVRLLDLPKRAAVHAGSALKAKSGEQSTGCSGRETGRFQRSEEVLK